MGILKTSSTHLALGHPLPKTPMRKAAEMPTLTAAQMQAAYKPVNDPILPKGKPKVFIRPTKSK